MQCLVRKTLGRPARRCPDLTLADYIRAIPGMASLADLPAGTPVLVRGDVDAKPGPNIGDGDIRLRSMVDTLQFGQRPRLEANHLRPHRPQTRRLARQSGQAAGRNPQVRCAAHQRLA